MKIVKQDKKKIISVLGAPHSGTTIVNNIINSMQNAFCISEPHWVIIRNVTKLKFDKVGKIQYSSQKDFMQGVKKKLQDSQYDFGGVKETYRSGEATMHEAYNTITSQSDIIIFVFRNPFALYNSQKLERNNTSNIANTHAIKGLKYNLIKQCELMKKCGDKSIALVLEDLCNAGDSGAINYLNKTLKNKVEFEGNFCLNKTEYIFGNPKANRSTNLRPANMEMSLVSKVEKQQLNSAYKIYKKLRLSE